MPSRDRQPFERLVRCLIVAKADSIGLLVRILCQCSGGEVEECHEFSSVFLQGQRRFGVFGLVGFDEQIEGCCQTNANQSLQGQ